MGVSIGVKRAVGRGVISVATAALCGLGATCVARGQDFLRPVGGAVHEDFAAPASTDPDTAYDVDIAAATSEIFYLAERGPTLDRPNDELRRAKADLALAMVPEHRPSDAAKIAEAQARIHTVEAEIALIQGDLDAHLATAIDHLRDAHRIHPHLGLPIQYEGVAYLSGRHYQMALYRFWRACWISYWHTGHFQAQLLLGVADANTGLGYYLEADFIYKRIIALYPDQPDQIAAARAALAANQQEWDGRRHTLHKGPFCYDVTTDGTELALPPIPALVRGTGATFTAGGYVFSGVGYNDNLNRYPGRLTSGTKRAPVGERDDDFYNESSFSFSLDSRPFPRRYLVPGSDEPQVIADMLSLNYVLVSDTFGEYKADDRILQTGYVSYTRPLSDSFALSVKASDQWLHVEQALTQNKAVQQVGINYTTAFGSRLQANYYFQRIDGFADPVGEKRITDGFAHRAEFVGSQSLVSDRNDDISTLTFQGQYAHLWNAAVGAYNRYAADDVLALVSWMPWHAHASDPFPLLRNATFTFSNDWQPSAYAYATSRKLPPLSTDADTVTVGLSLKMLYTARVTGSNRLEALMQWQHTFTGANIPARIYEQNVYLSTLKLNF